MVSPPLAGVVASAGGVEPLRALVSTLPKDFGAVLLVVVHVSPDEPSVLPHILGRAGRLPSRHAEDGEPLEPGIVLVAPPDNHLTVRDGRVALGGGPKEWGHRPSGDRLLRSIALEAGDRAAGIVLSGMLDDGASGLRAIGSVGGLALVQDPREALFPAMPRAAIAAVAPDAVAPVARLAELLCGWADRLTETPSPFTCPDCGGSLWEEQLGGDKVRYRCRVGHAFSVSELVAEKADGFASALWSAVVALEERVDLMSSMAERYHTQGKPERAARYEETAQSAASEAKLLRRMIEDLNEELQDGGRRDERDSTA